MRLSMTPPSRVIFPSIFTLLLFSAYCQADCAHCCLGRVTQTGPFSYIFEYFGALDSTVTAIDTINPDRFLTGLVARFDSSRICFIGQIDTVKRYWAQSGNWWWNIDSVHVVVDTVLKGNVESSFWRTDIDTRTVCPTSQQDSNCWFPTDDTYASYATFAHKRFLFFADSLTNLRATSVVAGGCPPDKGKGNLVDDSDYVWSDGGPSPHTPTRTTLASFLNATGIINRIPSAHPAGLGFDDKLRAEAIIVFDIRGRAVRGVGHSPGVYTWGVKSGGAAKRRMAIVVQK